MTLVAALTPLILIDIGLRIYALVDLIRRPRVRGSKIPWGLLILLVGIIGPLAYLFLGREE